MVVVRKNISKEQGEMRLIDEIRYFFYISNDLPEVSSFLSIVRHTKPLTAIVNTEACWQKELRHRKFEANRNLQA
jgi:hypothetical protein